MLEHSSLPVGVTVYNNSTTIWRMSDWTLYKSTRLLGGNRAILLPTPPCGTALLGKDLARETAHLNNSQPHLALLAFGHIPSHLLPAKTVAKRRPSQVISKHLFFRPIVLRKIKIYLRPPMPGTEHLYGFVLCAIVCVRSVLEMKITIN